MSQLEINPKATISRHTKYTLALLTCAAFMYITFEIYLVGLIFPIAHDIGVSESEIGFLMSGYAVIAGLTTIPSIWLIRNLSRKTALIISLLALIVGEAITAIATNYSLLAASRIIAALTHGVLWSLMAPIAASLVPHEKCGAATATVQSGATIAIILGGPATTALGTAIGWRQTALILTLITLAITCGILRVLPHDIPTHNPLAKSAQTKQSKQSEQYKQSEQCEYSHDADHLINSHQLNHTVRSYPGISWHIVNIICGITIIFVFAHFISFTYCEIIVSHVTAHANAIALYMFLFGITGALSTIAIGKYNDKHPRNSTIASVLVFAIGIWLIPLSLHISHSLTADIILGIAVCIWGWGYAGIGPCYQSAIMRAAPRHQELCSSLYVTSYQIGSAAGAAVGGIILHYSIIWIPICSAIIAALAMICTLYWQKIFLLPNTRV